MPVIGTRNLVASVFKNGVGNVPVDSGKVETVCGEFTVCTSLSKPMRDSYNSTASLAHHAPLDYVVLVTSDHPVSENSSVSYGGVLREDIVETVLSSPTVEPTDMEGIVTAVVNPAEVISREQASASVGGENFVGAAFPSEPDVPRGMGRPTDVTYCIVAHVSRGGASQYMRSSQGILCIIEQAMLRAFRHADNETVRSELSASRGDGIAVERPYSTNAATGAMPLTMGFIVSDLRLSDDMFCSAQMMASYATSLFLKHTHTLVDRKFAGGQIAQMRSAFRGLTHSFYRKPVAFDRLEIVLPRDYLGVRGDLPVPTAGELELIRLFYLFGLSSPAVVRHALTIGVSPDPSALVSEVMRITTSGPYSHRFEQIARESSHAYARAFSQIQTRRLVDLRATEFRPATAHEHISMIFRATDPRKISIRVYRGHDRLVKLLGANLIHAVGRGAGSDVGSSLVVVEYLGTGDPTVPWVVLAGKGITFDAGGLNIKGTGSINNMHFDKAGAISCAMAVLGAYNLKASVNVAAVIPFAENTISATAYHPGDVITSMAGLTVDVDNTDAEGRLILADGIAYARYNYNIARLVTVATLTGAVHVALGNAYAAIYGNSEEFITEAVWASKIVDEPVWRMPLDKSYRSAMRSKGNASVINSAPSGTGAGSCTAAEFLRVFVETDMKPHFNARAAFPDGSPAAGPVTTSPSWIHMDVASVAVEDPGSRTPSGKPTKLLAYILQQCAEKITK